MVTEEFISKLRMVQLDSASVCRGERGEVSICFNYDTEKCKNYFETCSYARSLSQMRIISKDLTILTCCKMNLDY